MVGFFHRVKKDKGTKSLRKKKAELKKLVKEKKYDQVLKIGRDILEKNPDDIDVLFILGAVHYMRGKFSLAISCFDKVLEISAYDPQSLLLKANSHFKLGQYSIAVTCCDKLKEIDPKNKGVSELLEKISKKSNA